MTKQWWFENRDKNDRKIRFFKLWKGSLLWIFLLCFLSFFSLLNEFVTANKTNIVDKVSKLSDLKFTSENGISSHIWKFLRDYQDWKNVLKNNKIWLNFLQDNLEILISIAGYGPYKNHVLAIYNKYKPYQSIIYELLWENERKNYLIIFQNTSEERPDWWFFGSFAKISFDWWHLVDFEIYDSYYLLWKFCKTEWENWFEKCTNKKELSIENQNSNFSKLWPTTTFLTSNIYWFTDLNGENVVKHYNQVFSDKIEWVVFIKSDIVKYLFADWQDLLRNMEVLNALWTSTWKYQNSKHIKWFGWAKDDYLKFVQDMIFDKKQISQNFIKNYDKIVNNELVRVYLPHVNQDFKKFLIQEKMNLAQENDFAYLFFYNMWFNKNSKFIDHIVTINENVYINPSKIPLLKWQNLINFKNIWNDDFAYWDFLNSYNVPENSYLRDKTVNYENILIVPETCQIKHKTKNSYLVDCL